VSDEADDLPGYVAEQQAFYARTSKSARQGYVVTESLSIAAAAGVPVAVAAGAPQAIAALLGAVAAIATGLRQAFNFRENWILRAVALETIKASIARYRVAGVKGNPSRLIADVGAVSLAETSRWQQLISQSQAASEQPLAADVSVAAHRGDDDSGPEHPRRTTG
jgi:hypothetical protein